MAETMNDSSNADEELSTLLDSALADFTCLPNTDDEIDSMMEAMDHEAVQKAADNFDQLIKQYNETAYTSQQPQEQQNASASEQPPLSDRQMVENFQNMLKVFIEAETKHLNDESKMESSGDVDKADAEAFINQLKLSINVANRDPTTEMDESEFETLMNLVQNFFAKDVMYQPLKELLDKFPRYLADHPELSTEQRAVFEKQIAVLQRVCSEYEKEETDNAEEMKKRFDTISNLLIELQSYGYPPAEIVGDAPSGWIMDEQSGLPKVCDVSKAADSCTLM